ncbi:MAG: hypothetical protein ACOYXT_28130 [Bacteroidota bacterium]
MRKYIAIIFTLTMISCQDQEIDETGTFVVTINGVSFDCKLVIIDFFENDGERIKKTTGSDGLSYEAHNLDKSIFNKIGQELIVTVRKTHDDELFACTTMGLSYPRVTVINAELKNDAKSSQ